MSIVGQPKRPKPETPPPCLGLLARINNPAGVGIDFFYPGDTIEGVRYCVERCPPGHKWQVMHVRLRYWWSAEQVEVQPGVLEPDWVLQSDETPEQLLAEGTSRRSKPQAVS